MKDSEALYELVHTLSKNEKRYFKMYCAGLPGKESKNYLALFSVLDKQKEYDSVALKRQLKNPSLVKNISAEKNYLFNLILDSLLAYHREQQGHKIRILISKSQLLHDKGLMKSSSKLLLSAKKLALTYDKKELLLDILSLQSKQFFHVRDSKKLVEFADERSETVQQILNENAYNVLLARLLEYSLDTTYIRDPAQLAKLEALMDDELMQDESKAISLQSKLLFFNIRSYYYFLVKKKGTLLENNRRMLELFEENPGYTSGNLNDYLSTLSNFISDAMVTGNINDVKNATHKLEEFPKIYEKHISPVVYENYRHLYLEVIAKVNGWLGEFEKIISLLPEMKALVVNKRVLKSHRRQSVAFYTALALFANKRYKETLRMLHEVEDIHEAGSGSYLYFMQTMFLRFMTHYDLGNSDVLEEQTSWLRQFLVKQNKLRKSEEQLLSFFSALPELTPGKVTRERFKEEYEKQLELLNDDYESSFLMVMTFVRNWVKSKAENLDFTEVTKQRLSARTS